MFSNSLVFVSFICLLARGSFAAISCDSAAIVDTDNCLRAIHQIVYKANNTLGTESKSFSYIYGNCSISVSNDYGATATRNQVENAFIQIIDHCKPHTGAGSVPGAEQLFLSVGYRLKGGDAPYNSDFPFLKPACGLNENAPAFKNEDCLKAYDSIPVTAEGQLSTPANDISGKILKTYGTCTVYIHTSDASRIVARGGDVHTAFEKMLGECNGKSGVLTMKDGAQGDNGRLFVKVRSSLRCGVDNPERQVCH